MPHRILADKRRLHRLLADLDRLERGEFSAPCLVAEPTLDNWLFDFRKVSCLSGVVEGHPSVPDGKVIHTSEIFAFLDDDGERFARTLSRWYRLEERHRLHT